MKHVSQAIPEERIPAILARAAELDKQTITIDALRTAALDAGISAAAIDQAVREYVAGDMPITSIAEQVQVQPEKRGWRRWLDNLMEPIKFGAFGFILALFAAGDSDWAVVPIAASIAFACYFAIRERSTRDTRRFQLLTLALGGTAFLTMALTGADEDAISVQAFVMVVLLALGSLFVQLANRRSAVEKEVRA